MSLARVSAPALRTIVDRAGGKGVLLEPQADLRAENIVVHIVNGGTIEVDPTGKVVASVPRDE